MRPTLPWYLRWAWPFALIGGTIAYVVMLLILLITRNPPMFPTLLFVGSFTVPLAVLLYASIGKYGSLAPTPVIVLTVLLGGVVGIILSGSVEFLTGLVLGQATVWLVGLIEETVKLVVPVAVLLFAFRATRLGGVVIGIAAGTGFAVLETMGYGFDALLMRGGGLAAVDTTLLLRGILAPAGHIAWTGLICAALWMLRSSDRRGIGVLASAAAFLAAVVLHTLWDAVPSLALHCVIGILSVGALITVTVLAHRRHNREAQIGPVGPGRAPGPHQAQSGPVAAPQS